VAYEVRPLVACVISHGSNEKQVPSLAGRTRIRRIGSTLEKHTAIDAESMHSSWVVREVPIFKPKHFKETQVIETSVFWRGWRVAPTYKQHPWHCACVKKISSELVHMVLKVALDKHHVKGLEVAACLVAHCVAIEVVQIHQI
jgi:hypothetical protein